jgi:hypothetical protein
MSRTQPAQLNIRSSFARERAMELAMKTGMTTTRIIEEALRAYTPPPVAEVGSLVRRMGVLVRPSSGRTVTLEEANAAAEAGRNRDDDD